MLIQHRTRQWTAFALSDMTNAITATGTKFTQGMPGCIIFAVAATLASPCAAGTFTIDINSGGVSVLSTPITIDATETDSRDAITQPVIIPASQVQSNGWIMTLDVDNVGDSTAIGAVVELFVQWINTTAV